MRTSRILLGTSISSVFVRTAPTIAMAASSVADLSGGRFILGLGSSHKAQVGPEHGVVYSKPLTRTRETVAIVRELIREGRVSFQGETIRIENFDLWYTPRHRDMPVYLSAVFQKGIALCGEVADGIILTRSTLQHGRAGAGATGRGRAQSRTRPGQDRGHHLVADLGRRNTRCGTRRVAPGHRVLLRVLPTLQPDDGRAWLRRPKPPRSPRHGRAVIARRPSSAVSDAMIDATSIAGTPEQCRARIEAYRQSGIDVPIISPFARGPDAKARFEAAIRACAPAQSG